MSKTSCYPSLPKTPAWSALANHRKVMFATSLKELFANDNDRFDRFALKLNSSDGPFLLDPSKNCITQETLNLLCQLADESGLKKAISAMFNGEVINKTEGRAALHIALRNRSNTPLQVHGKDVMPNVNTVLEKIEGFVDAIHNGTQKGETGEKFTDIVNIGIGGSDLGPAMVCQALRPYWQAGLRPHFVSNVDAAHICEVLEKLDPKSTLFVITSKTFTTQETMRNALTARAWIVKHLGDSAIRSHFTAVSTNEKLVKDFGIAPENMFEFWDWVGGRYSLWSAVGLSIALTVGMDGFKSLLSGAHKMDKHFTCTPFQENLPVILGLLGIWNHTVLGAKALAILPYDQSLSRFPAFLQQLEMESNGKNVTSTGSNIATNTQPIVFGEVGTNGQHSFYQILHQGAHSVPCDFIIVARSHHEIGEHQQILLANALAQSEALMCGQNAKEAETSLLKQGKTASEAKALAPHTTFSGNRPSTTILLPQVTPETLGMLIALYEHKVFVQSIIWGVNAFDQWGVELGKSLAKTILPELNGSASPSGHDSSTTALIDLVRALRSTDT